MIVAAILRLVFLVREPNPQDPSLTNWTIVLCAQLVQNSSIITACVPYLKPLLESLESGMIRNDDIRRRGHTRISDSGGYDHHYLPDLSSKRKQGWPTHISSVSAPRTATSDVVISSGGQDEPQNWDAESQRSSSRMIKTTRTWAVDRA